MTCGTLGLIPKRNRLKFQTLKSSFCFLLIKIYTLTIAILSTLKSTFCDTTIRGACKHSKWFLLAQIRQNLEFGSLKYVTYMHPIWAHLGGLNYNEGDDDDDVVEEKIRKGNRRISLRAITMLNHKHCYKYHNVFLLYLMTDTAFTRRYWWNFGLIYWTICAYCFWVWRICYLCVPDSCPKVVKWNE